MPVYERPSGAGRSGAAITFESDGGVTVNLGVPDVGPGIHTVVQQIVGEMLDLPRERVTSVCKTPTARPTTLVLEEASRPIASAPPPIRQSLKLKKNRHIGRGSTGLQARRFTSERSLCRARTESMPFGDLMRLAVEQNHGVITHLSVYEPARAAITSFAAQVAEVEVDAGTGQVKVKKLTTVHDSGTVLNHLSYQGQIDGGVVTGLGFALMEDSSW